MQQAKLYELSRLISFRHDLHKHAELSYQEFRTSEKIREYIISLGIPESDIKKVAKTGLVIDINGKAAPSGSPMVVALRADMDGLPIKEKNPKIAYESVTEAAHMCGHDMHMTCLLGGVSLILDNIEKIPSDKKVRLLFQPAEEYIGGALPMIKEGALDGVDEVYGFHNWPWEKPGKMYVKKGFMMSCITDIVAVIHGKGGHSSIPEQLKDPLQPAVDFHVKLRGLIKDYKAKGEKFALCLPYIKTGNAPNAISDTCEIKGMLRTYGEEFTKDIRSKIRNLIEESCNEFKCTADIQINERYPPVFNHDKETEHVVRIGKKVLGDDNVSEDPRLPVYAGEDFSFFINEKPGAFFFLSSARNDDDVLHTDRFDANDDMIEKASEIWLRLIEDRFNITL